MRSQEVIMDRGAIARWKVDDGKLTTDSGALVNTPFTRESRFELEAFPSGSSPEELLAASVAGCFAMTFARQLGNHHHVPYELRVEARVMLVRPKAHAPWTVPAVRLHCTALLTGVADDDLAAMAHAAKAESPIIRAMGVDVALTITRDRPEDWHEHPPVQ
jgi:osmotically inducible protein OsmC